MSARDLAKRAHAVVCRQRDADESLAELRTFCMHAPVRLRQAGALQAVAFWRRNKGGRACVGLLAYVLNGAEDHDGSNLVDKLAACDSTTYLTQSRRLVEAAMWLRRFAQAELGDPYETDVAQ